SGKRPEQHRNTSSLILYRALAARLFSAVSKRTAMPHKPHRYPLFYSSERLKTMLATACKRLLSFT
ncbi:MAG: hypothetical protein ACKVLM_23360, partial [Pseudomonadales bacterium]